MRGLGPVAEVVAAHAADALEQLRPQELGRVVAPIPFASSVYLATEALLYHELAIAAVALLIVSLTWGAPNQTGALAFLILFGMRLSAKLNIFLGVPNLTDELMPSRIAYLKTYFRKADRNPLFPVSIAVSTSIAALLAWRALGATAGGAEAVGFTLLFALLLLAIVEHGFMVLPVRDAALWRWAMPAAPPGSKERLP